MTILLESAIRVTLIAAVIGLVLVAMRIKTSSLLHAVWASVVVLMMLLPAWLAWGPKAPIPVLPSQATTAIAPFDLVPPPSPAGLPQPSTSPVREDREYSLREYAILPVRIGTDDDVFAQAFRGRNVLALDFGGIHAERVEKSYIQCIFLA
jgi:hypothetical protein